MRYSIALIVGCLTLLAAAQDSRLIDTRSNQYPLPTGIVHPGTAAPGLKPKQPSNLRLTVLIQDPEHVEFGKPLEFEVRLKNITSADAIIPNSPLDTVARLATKESKCLMTGVTLQLRGTQASAQKTLVDLFHFGSQDVAGSTVALKPGDEVRILGRVPKLGAWAPFIQGHVYAVVGNAVVWWSAGKDDDRCNKAKATPATFIESADGPELDLRNLPAP